MSERVINDLDATERRARAMLEDHRRQIEELARRREPTRLTC
jgi:hypothetical protein